MTDTNQTTAITNPHVGLGGWLILLQICLWLSLLSCITPIFNGIYRTNTIAESAVILAAINFVWIAVLMGLMLSKYWLFPNIFIATLIILIATDLIAGLMGSKDSLANAIARLIVGSPWIAYMLMSRRVKNTFVRKNILEVQHITIAAIDCKKLKRHMAELTVSFVASWCLITPAIVIIVLHDFVKYTLSDTIANILIFGILVVGLIFYIVLGILAKALGKKWFTWVGLAFIFKPIGGIVAYLLMRANVKKTLKTTTQ